MIRLTDVYKRYGNNRVLNGVSLGFGEGTVTGIVGENGAGKTTLFRSMAGLEKFEGKLESRWEPLKNHLGFLPTEPWFLPRMTGREYLRLMCLARQTDPSGIDGQNIFELPLNRYAADYSTGMKKKLAMTGILLQDNRVFILDEPYNGVDIHSNLVITEIIHRLKQSGKTIILSSHIFSTLVSTCDVIHLLAEGTIKRSVRTEDFSSLEEDLRNFALGNRLNQLKL